jgi:hypothetical protein
MAWLQLLARYRPCALPILRSLCHDCNILCHGFVRRFRIRNRLHGALDIGTNGISGNTQEPAPYTTGGEFALVDQAANGALGNTAQLPGDFFQ